MDKYKQKIKWYRQLN